MKGTVRSNIRPNRPHYNPRIIRYDQRWNELRADNGNDKTFSEVAKSIMSMVLHQGDNSESIDEALDVYRKTPIKIAQVLQRCKHNNPSSKQASKHTKSISSGHIVQQWGKLLCTSYKKSDQVLGEQITHGWRWGHLSYRRVSGNGHRKSDCVRSRRSYSFHNFRIAFCFPASIKIHGANGSEI